MFGDYAHMLTIYSDQQLHQLAQFSEFDPVLNDYIVVKDIARLVLKVEEALKRACLELRSKLHCCGYDLKQLDELLAAGEIFEVLKDFEAKLAYNILKEGSDCEECRACLAGFDAYCKCTVICSDQGNCLIKKPLFCVEVKKSCIPSMCDICCDSKCCCDKLESAEVVP